MADKDRKVSPTRQIVTIIIGVAALAALIVLCYVRGYFGYLKPKAERSFPRRTRTKSEPVQGEDGLYVRGDADRLTHDYAGLLTDDENMIDSAVKRMRDDQKVEFVVLTVADAGRRTVGDYAQELFEKWQIGKRCGGRGLLLLIAKDENESRLHVGYALEHIFPDALCRRIQNEQMQPWLNAKMPGIAVLDTAFMAGHRIAYGIESEDLDVTEEEVTTAHLTGGAGARQTLIFMGSPEKKEILSDKERVRFKAGDSPREVLALFVEAMSEGINDPTLDMYTPRTQVFFSFEPTRTMEYREYARVLKASPSFKEYRLDNHAVLMPTARLSTSFPVLFERWPDGWRLDWSTFFWGFGVVSGRWWLLHVPHAYFFGLRDWPMQGPREGLWNAQGFIKQLNPAGDIHAEIARIQAAMAAGTESADDLQQLGEIYFASWCWPKALPIFWKAAEKSADHGRWRRLADINSAMRRHTTAYAAYEQASELAEPDDFHQPYYQRCRGFQKMRLGDYDKALEHCERALKLARRRRNYYEINTCYKYSAAIYRALGKEQEVQRCLQKAKEESGDGFSTADLVRFTQ